MADKAPKDQASGNMVLRTVYLPVDVDEKLKKTALLRQRSKNDVIRNFIVQGLRKEAENAPTRHAREPVTVESPKRVALDETVSVRDAGSDEIQPGGSRRSR